MTRGAGRPHRSILAVPAHCLQRPLAAALRAAPNSSARLGIRPIAHDLATLAYPVRQLRTVEVVRAVVDRGRDAPVFKVEEHCMGALGGTLGVPPARVGTHATDQATAEHPENIELMGSLTVGDSAPHRGVELLRQARSIEPVVV